MSAPSHDRGTGHFIRERLTSILLVPLTVWFVATLVAYAGADHAQVEALLRDPLNAALMTAFVLIGLYHSALGVQVVIEDYSSDPLRRTLILGAYAAHVIVALVCVYALALILF